ncbi:hypothetical protein FC093_21985 [Ilyomonas limi]|uniref:YcxB family protein n=1 Tax=Ilyomonas limi TaxID=2575867 RepID=A0A4U3KR74_9BACT|nr:hypothetical protein [Ilyomonas limi]TKK64721.1 hypothetical protein FC093_21985 [Ilyomonas limi]
MQQFKIELKGFRDISNKAIMRTIPVMLLAGATGMYISVSSNSNDVDDVGILPYVIVTVLIGLAIGLYKGINRQKKLLESYTLTIGNNLITREQSNTPTISLYYNEISEIAKSPNNTILIKGKKASDVIIVPKQIEKYERIETLLQEIKPFTRVSSDSVLNRYRSVLSLILIGLMVCLYTTIDKVLVTITGASLIVFMVWGIVKLRSNKNADSKTKRTSIVSIFVLACIIAVMFIKLSSLEPQQFSILTLTTMIQ